VKKRKESGKRKVVNLEILREEFQVEMMALYERTKNECDYNALRFLQMVNERGAVEAARQLIHTPMADGLEVLWEYGRLDLSVEAYVLHPKWRPLFLPEEIAICKQKLAKLDYDYKAEKR
jgi:hypothetical protein